MYTAASLARTAIAIGEDSVTIFVNATRSVTPGSPVVAGVVPPALVDDFVVVFAVAPVAVLEGAGAPLVVLSDDVDVDDVDLRVVLVARTSLSLSPDEQAAITTSSTAATIFTG
jgi:hypothetical protein